MSTPEEIAAALERDIAAAINKHSAENGSNTPDWIIAEYLVRCLGALDGAVTAREKWYGCEHSPAILRTANPPAGSERATEPVCPTCRGWGIIGSERAAIEGHASHESPCPDCDPIHALGVALATPPATPAVGEDAGADCECTCAAELAEKVRALLADVARLQKELDGTTFREERYAEDAVGARLALEDARAEVARLTEERDNTTKALRRADSMLTAVRKIADDYHDVDVTGDPPREVACNPCANDILNVLEGRKP